MVLQFVRVWTFCLADDTLLLVRIVDWLWANWWKPFSIYKNRQAEIKCLKWVSPGAVHGLFTAPKWKTVKAAGWCSPKIAHSRRVSRRAFPPSMRMPPLVVHINGWPQLRGTEVEVVAGCFQWPIMCLWSFAASNGRYSLWASSWQTSWHIRRLSFGVRGSNQELYQPLEINSIALQGPTWDSNHPSTRETVCILRELKGDRNFPTRLTRLIK